MLKLDISEFEAQAKRLRARMDQVPFAVSVAMNESAKKTRRYLIEQTWPKSVTARNTAFMNAALLTKFSRKDNLTVEIYDRLGKANLAKHADGGEKTARKKNLAIPLKAWVKYTAQGIRKDMLPRQLIDNTPKRALRVTPRGIFVGQGGRLQLRYVLKPSARIKKDVPFYQDFEQQMRANMRQEFPKALDRAMQTAK